MILFDKANPLEEIAEIIRQANPELAGSINGDNIIVDKIENVNPDQNDGFNTKAIVRTVGVLNDTLGVVDVRFNRIDLTKYIPPNSVRVQCPSERGVVRPMNLEAVLSKGLGTKLESTGRYRDYYAYTGGINCQKGQVVSVNITPQSESLRYMPKNFSFKVFGLGISLEHAISTQGQKPFEDDRGCILYTGDGKNWFANNIRTIDDTRRSHAATMGMADFTSVWGEDPRTVIIEHGEPDKLRFKFEDEAFGKINDILRAWGLPILPNPYFQSYILNSYYDTKHGSRYQGSSMPRVMNYGLRIPHSDTDWDYFNLANFIDEKDSSYWGRASDYCYFNYQVK